MHDVALDKEWFEIYKGGSSFDEIGYLRLNQEKLAMQKELFIANKIDEPTLEYDDTVKVLSRHRDHLLQLQDKLESSQSVHPIVKEVYNLKVNEQLTKVSFLEAVQGKDNQLMGSKSIGLYGAPNRDTMRRALSVILYVANKKQVDLSDTWQELAQYFGAECDNSDIDYHVVAGQEYMSTAELVKLFEEALTERSILWNVKVSSSALAVSLNYKDQTIYIPTDRKVTKIAAEALIDHEIGVHLARHFNGLSSPLLLLSTGLHSYLKAEEGLATFRQTSIDNLLPGTINYLSVGLASGLHKGVPWNFREVFNLLNQYVVFDGLPADQIIETSWKRSLRTFRGTTGRAGDIFTRDIIYFEGYLEIRSLIETNSPEVSRFLAGKYDPTNTTHLEILDELGIT
jgi:hypothetical protein